MGKLSIIIKTTALLICLLAIIPAHNIAQEKKSSARLSGWMKYDNSVIIPKFDDGWVTESIIRNRLNFKWQIENFSLVAGMRNRFFYGETVEDIPNYSDLVEDDFGFLDLSWTVFEGPSYFLNVNFDRLYGEWANDKFEVRVLRQRINWGRTTVWNPNDIFNTYNYFAFDYEERPGTDAVKATYFTGDLSSMEVAWAFADSLEASTLAYMYKFNKHEYDVQLLAGKFKKELVLGLGWEGRIKKAGFAGEVSYFVSFEDTVENTFLSTISINYSFKNSLSLRSEALFNSAGSSGLPEMNLNLTNINVKNLSLVKFTWFNSLSYQVSPLLNAGFATIFSPNDHSSYAGPSVTVSLSDNSEMILTGFLFNGPEGSQYGLLGKFLFGRIKWAF